MDPEDLLNQATADPARSDLIVSTISYQIAFDGNAVETDFYGDVVSITVQENVSTATTLRLQLVTRLQDDGTWTHLDDERLAPFSQLSVTLGFSGGGIAGALGGALGGGNNDGLEPVFDGYITGLNNLR